MSTEADQNAENAHNLPQPQLQNTQPKQRRKDKLEALANIDIQFEESSPAQKFKRKRIYKRPSQNKISAPSSSTVPVQSPNVTNQANSEEQSLLQEVFNKNCEIFLNLPDTDKYLRRIAEEQVRVNYLLAVYGMPDINFNLWSDSETLDFQLRERLKQRSVRKNSTKRDDENENRVN